MRHPALPALLLVVAALLLFALWRVVGGTSARTPVAESTAALSAPPLSSAPALESGPAEPREDPALSTRTSGPAVPRLHGRVLRAGERTPVAGAEVECAELARQEWLPSGTERTGPSQTTRSAAEGRFEFLGLDPSRQYSLSVTCPGWISAGTRPTLTPSDEVHELLLQRLYTVTLVATEADGRELEAETCEFLRYVRETRPGECAAREIPVTERPGRRQRYVFASDCDLPRLGPFKVLVSSPGYLREDHEFWALPLGPREVEVMLALHRPAPVCGTLLVRQECGCGAKICAHLLEGQVELELASGEHPPRQLALSGLRREESLLALPAGSWRARVRAKHGGFEHPARGEPPLELEIGSGQTVLSVPVSRLGALRLRQRGIGDQAPTAGVKLVPPAGATGAQPIELWLSTVVRGLEEGTHAFRIEREGGLDVEGCEWMPTRGGGELRIPISAGEIVQVLVRTP